jgi:hypothetical protein
VRYLLLFLAVSCDGTPPPSAPLFCLDWRLAYESDCGPLAPLARSTYAEEASVDGIMSQVISLSDDGHTVNIWSVMCHDGSCQTVSTQFSAPGLRDHIIAQGNAEIERDRIEHP